MWTSIQKFTSVSVGFISSIVLARLLSPDDYGCIGLLSIFMVVSNALVEGGFNSALVQKKRPTQEDYTVVFYWNITIALLCYLFLFFAAPFIAGYYRTPLLTSVLRVQGLTLIINSLQTVHVSQMYKQFRFRKMAIITIITSVIVFPVSIWMAYNGYGVWTLVTQAILTTFIPCLIYWLTDKWKPLPYFSVKSFKALFSFGSYILIGSLVSQVINNIQGIFIGRIYNPARMGYYTKAYSTQQLAIQTGNEIISQVTFPLFSEIQDERERMILTIKKIQGVLSLVIFPFLFALILLAKPIFILLYSDKWMESVPYFQVLCLSGLTICLQSSLGQAIKSMGLSKVQFYWGIFNNICGLAFVIGGLMINGIMGMLWGMVLRCWLSYFISTYQVAKYIGFSIKEQFLNLLPTLLITMASFYSGYFIHGLLFDNIYLNAIVQFAVFVSVYVLGVYVFRLDSKDTLFELLQPFIEKLRIKRR